MDRVAAGAGAEHQSSLDSARLLGSRPAGGASGVRGRRRRPAEPVSRNRGISLLDALSEISSLANGPSSASLG